MKDLKHLYTLEKLLESAHNELVQQAVDEGKHALGYTCYHMPEVLLNAGNCFSVRLRAPRTGSMDISGYYMNNFICDYCKSLLERGIEGGYHFLSAIMGTETCSEMNRALEHFELMPIVDHEGFFVSFLDMPFKTTEAAVKHYVTQLQVKVLDRMHDAFGTDVSDEALRKAVEEHNEVCRLITEIGEYRKEDNPRITGYEFAVLNVASYACPKAQILPYLRNTAEELKTREPDPKPWYRARVMLVGSELDDPAITKLLEMTGAFVVADRYCFGSLPGREQIEIAPGQDALDAIARHYMTINECPRPMGTEATVGRREYMYNLAKAYGAEGVILENMKFCEYWGYERAIAGKWLSEGHKLPGSIPTCQIETDYTNASSGQLRTRFQAFVESLEIKRIQKEG